MDVLRHALCGLVLSVIFSFGKLPASVVAEIAVTGINVLANFLFAIFPFLAFFSLPP
jgi:hypothetical protein